MFMVSKSLDVYVLLKLSLLDEFSSYVGLGNQLIMSASEVHASVQRSIIAGLIHPESRLPMRKPFEEYLYHGVRYAFPAPLGVATRGVPTAYAAPPLNQLIEYADLPPVWLSGNGDVKGVRVEPLHKSAQHMRKKNPDFYELLALVDALRMGRRREYDYAVEELKRRLFHVRD
jgi:hypothetical protein